MPSGHIGRYLFDKGIQVVGVDISEKCVETEIYFVLFTKEEIIDYFIRAGFLLEFIEKRNPYEFEIRNERIFAIGKKTKG